MSSPVIITCAITGAETSKDLQPALPVTPKEQGKAAAEAVAAGASIIHLHVRDDNGQPSQDPDRFKKTISEIKKQAGDNVIIQISTGGAVGENIESRLAPLALKPEMASLNMGSLNFGDDVFINTPSDIKQMAAEIYKQGIIPELEIYEVGMLESAAKLYKQGLLKSPLHFQFVLGVPGGLSGHDKNLSHLLDMMKVYFPKETSWGVAGIGRYEFPVAEYAIQRGGHVRVGFEDNIYFTKGVLAESNAQLVEHVAGIAKKARRQVATVSETRSLLNL